MDRLDKRVAEAVAAGDDRACEMRGVCGAGVVRLGVGSLASSRVLLVLWFLKTTTDNNKSRDTPLCSSPRRYKNELESALTAAAGPAPQSLLHGLLGVAKVRADVLELPPEHLNRTEHNHLRPQRACRLDRKVEELLLLGDLDEVVVVARLDLAVEADHAGGGLLQSGWGDRV